MNDLERVETKVDSLIRSFADLRQQIEGEKKPGLTAVAFAKAAGLSVTTVYRRLASGQLRRVKGRIPRELLNPYVS